MLSRLKIYNQRKLGASIFERFARLDEEAYYYVQKNI